MTFTTNQFKHDQKTLKPQTWRIEFEGETGIILVRKAYHGGLERMTVTRTQDGQFKNEFDVLFIQIKPDRRPKPFSVLSQEEGRGPWSVEKFATIQEVQKYVRDGVARSISTAHSVSTRTTAATN
ncbi:MAG: hypothetical protein DMG38_26145 [Acidobacteria bacterium]|nr:MAG: hypothetical protein DMG38_26145 [Acidobacteriota bacterium]